MAMFVSYKLFWLSFLCHIYKLSGPIKLCWQSFYKFYLELCK